MKKSRKIDDIYREKLRNVETPPPADVWGNIAAQLPAGKPHRKVLPVWFRLAGAAAAVALLLLLFNTPEGNEPYNTITNNPHQLQEKRNEFNPVSPSFRESMVRSSIILEALKIDTEINKRRGERGNQGEEPYTTSQFAVNNASAEINSKKIFNSNADTDYPEFPLTGVAGISGEERSTKGLDYTFKKYISSETKTNAAESQVENNSLAAVIKRQEDIAEEELKSETEAESSPAKRFSIATTAAAVYFDNLGSGNTVEGQLAGGEGNGEISMAYGINLGYQLSEKVKIRTGVSKVNLSQNINGVALASAANATTLEERTLNVASSPEVGFLNQRLGFIEVPLEMEYAIVNKRWGLSLIGGASTLFLDENQISLNSPNYTASIGEAGNLNNVSFSTNVGIGVNYDLSPSFRVNLEPIFKYQINTFNNTSGLKPYFFGIYSGLNFKF